MSYSALIRKDNPEIFWSLDEISGNIAKCDGYIIEGIRPKSGGYTSVKYNGLYSPSVGSQISRSPFPIIYGGNGCIKINNDIAQIKLPSLSKMTESDANNSSAIEFWIKISNVSSTKQSIMTTNSGAEIYIKNDYIVFSIEKYFVSVPIDSVNKPIHIIAGYSPNEITLIVNGVLRSKQIYNSGQIFTSTIAQGTAFEDNYFIFKKPQLINNFQIDSVALYSYVPSKITAIRHFVYGVGRDVESDFFAKNNGVNYNFSMESHKTTNQFSMGQGDGNWKITYSDNLQIDPDLDSLTIKKRNIVNIGFPYDYKNSELTKQSYFTSSGYSFNTMSYLELNNTKSVIPSIDGGWICKFNYSDVITSNDQTLLYLGSNQDYIRFVVKNNSNRISIDINNSYGTATAIGNYNQNTISIVNPTTNPQVGMYVDAQGIDKKVYILSIDSVNTVSDSVTYTVTLSKNNLDIVNGQAVLNDIYIPLAGAYQQGDYFYLGYYVNEDDSIDFIYIPSSETSLSKTTIINYLNYENINFADDPIRIGSEKSWTSATSKQSFENDTIDENLCSFFLSEIRGIHYLNNLYCRSKIDIESDKFKHYYTLTPDNVEKRFKAKSYGMGLISIPLQSLNLNDMSACRLEIGSPVGNDNLQVYVSGTSYDPTTENESTFIQNLQLSDRVIVDGSWLNKQNINLNDDINYSDILEFSFYFYTNDLDEQPPHLNYLRLYSYPIIEENNNQYVTCYGSSPGNPVKIYKRDNEFAIPDLTEKPFFYNGFNSGIKIGKSYAKIEHNFVSPNKNATITGVASNGTDTIISLDRNPFVLNDYITISDTFTQLTGVSISYKYIDDAIIFQKNNHSLVDNDIVEIDLTQGTLPKNIELDKYYYVKKIDNNSFYLKEGLLSDYILYSEEDTTISGSTFSLIVYNKSPIQSLNPYRVKSSVGNDITIGLNSTNFTWIAEPENGGFTTGGICSIMSGISSVSFFVYSDEITNPLKLLKVGNNQISLNTNGTITSNGTFSSVINNGSSFTFGCWNHIGIIFNSPVLVYAGSYISLEIGDSGSQSSTFYFDQLAIFDKKLTTDELSNLYLLYVGQPSYSITDDKKYSLIDLGPAKSGEDEYTIQETINDTYILDQKTGNTIYDTLYSNNYTNVTATGTKDTNQITLTSVPAGFIPVTGMFVYDNLPANNNSKIIPNTYVTGVTKPNLNYVLTLSNNNKNALSSTQLTLSGQKTMSLQYLKTEPFENIKKIAKRSANERTLYLSDTDYLYKTLNAAVGLNLLANYNPSFEEAAYLNRWKPIPFAYNNTTNTNSLSREYSKIYSYNGTYRLSMNVSVLKPNTEFWGAKMYKNAETLQRFSFSDLSLADNQQYTFSAFVKVPYLKSIDYKPSEKCYVFVEVSDAQTGGQSIIIEGDSLTDLTTSWKKVSVTFTANTGKFYNFGIIDDTKYNEVKVAATLLVDSVSLQSAETANVGETKTQIYSINGDTSYNGHKISAISSESYRNYSTANPVFRVPAGAPFKYTVNLPNHNFTNNKIYVGDIISCEGIIEPNTIVQSVDETNKQITFQNLEKNALISDIPANKTVYFISKEKYATFNSLYGFDKVVAGSEIVFTNYNYDKNVETNNKLKIDDSMLKVGDNILIFENNDKTRSKLFEVTEIDSNIYHTSKTISVIFTQVPLVDKVVYTNNLNNIQETGSSYKYNISTDNFAGFAKFRDKKISYAFNPKYPIQE